ncbi:MAG: DUF3431 domain-containing protein [Verrucomicrobiota bacterium]
MVDIVVAKYNEDIAWTRNVKPGARVILYNKGHDSCGVKLPNVGREAHTYLYHIVQFYDELAPVTVFCQGHPFDHASDFHKRIKNVVSGREQIKDFTWLGFIIDTDDKRGRSLFIHWSKNVEGEELPLDQFYYTLFKKESPEIFRFYPGGQFIVRAETIRKRSKAFYQKALNLSEKFLHSAHCFERIWDQVFGCSGVDETLLKGENCVYLKPIKRLIT